MSSAGPYGGIMGQPLAVPFVVPQSAPPDSWYGHGMQLLRRLGPIHPEPLLSQITGHIVICGYSVRETSGTAVASLILRNGADATGLEFLGINLNPSGTRDAWYGWDGVHLDIGYFPSLVAGAVAGSVWVRDWSEVGFDVGSQSGY